jgi:sugar (pentulose or hexulose) kinase
MRVVGDVAAAGQGVRSRALLEGLSLQTRWMRDVQRRLDPGPEPALVLFGGPGARNDAWTRVKAEVLADGIRVVTEHEPVAVGAAVVGAERAGLVEPGSVVLPAGDATPMADRYAETYEQFVREARGERRT